jgi:hypothetical protein
MPRSTKKPKLYKEWVCPKCGWELNNPIPCSAAQHKRNGDFHKLRPKEKVAVT